MAANVVKHVTVLVVITNVPRRFLGFDFLGLLGSKTLYINAPYLIGETVEEAMASVALALRLKLQSPSLNEKPVSYSDLPLVRLNVGDTLRMDCSY